MPKLFVTGATGFLGSRLVERLRQLPHQIVALSRSGAPPAASAAAAAGGAVRLVRGDLNQSASYAADLAGADTVLHLAAVTGKARPHDYLRTNVEGTRALVERCRAAGVRRFLFVSSIAVTFPDTRRYYYARSKAEAERIVAASGLDFVILRPTIIVGPGSPVLAGLRKLAGLPVVPVFGDGRAKVQPIFVADLVDLILMVLEQERFRGETLELGGPQTPTIQEFMGEIHLRLCGKRARFVHLPLSLVLPSLALLEHVAYPVLPVTVGQLSTFRFDGTAAPNALLDSHRARLTTLSEMVRRSLAG